MQVRNASRLAGCLDVWTIDDQRAPQVVFPDNFRDASLKIGSPGCAGAAITVGAYVTKNAWTDIDGTRQQVGFPIDEIAAFSSDGPLRGGGRKPDIIAPGAMIVSCLSADSAPSRAEIIDATHFAKAGTSMATPFISGVVALLLERDPRLDPAAIKAALKKASRVPGKPAGAFDPKWGFGLLDGGKL